MSMRTAVTSLLLSAVFAGCSLVGIRTSPEPQYRVLRQEGNKEIREYPRMLVASTVTRGSYEEASNPSFRTLADFIFGNNRPVSPPTERAEAGTSIPMTAPVFQKPVADGWEMSFVMPRDYAENTLPAPNNPAVSVRPVPGFHVAVIRYSGLVTGSRIREKADELAAWLQRIGATPVSEPFSARYDPPWTLPFLRRNEVLIEITAAP